MLPSILFKDIIFVRSLIDVAMAVYRFFNLNKELTPIYKGEKDVRVLTNAAKEFMKDDNLREEVEALKALLK